MLIPTTRVERRFLTRRDGLWQEVWVHFLVYRDGTTGDQRAVQDKMVPGGVYREATIHEHSIEGEAEWIDERGIKHRLIALKVLQHAYV